MAYRRALLLFVFGNAIVLAMPLSLLAQKVDSTRADSAHSVTFVPSANNFATPPERTIDLVLTGGAGYYFQGVTSAIQPTASADFFAQTSDLDFTAGFHWGFSEPSTKSLSIGLRFPITESVNWGSGVFADAALLLGDDGRDSNAFSTGIRAAVAARTSFFEYRFAAELRRFPFGGDRFEAWGGLELGFAFNLIREESGTAQSPKDSLRAELRYIATTSELEALDKASSDQEIQSWLDRFWQARNATGSPMNEERQEYMRRVQEANEKYGSPGRMGVNTDQGRVLLLYGDPDRVQTANSTVNLERKYVLWEYQNRVKARQTAFFLFVKSAQAEESGTFGGHGEFREIYSNVPGEPSDGIPTDLPLTTYYYIQGFR